MNLAELYLDRYLYRDNDQDSETKDSAFVAADSSEAEPAAIPSGGAAQDINTGNVMIDEELIPSGTLAVGDWGWAQTCVFTSTDLNTVSWGGGSFIDAAGNTYTIAAGNTDARLTAAGLTSPMNAKVYIYLSLLESETLYYCSYTPGDAVGVGKVIIAVAQNAAVDATFNLTEATQIVGDNILANTIEAGKLNVGQLSAISVDAGALTSGSISVIAGGNTIGFTPAGGNAIFAGPTGAPTFYVTPAGALTATSVTISGSVAAGVGSAWTGNSIAAAYIGNLDASKITTGSLSVSRTDADVTQTALNAGASIDNAKANGTTLITGGYISTGIITAQNINAGNLDAARISAVSLSAVQANISDLSVLRANMGTITAGTFKVSTRINIQKSDTTAVAYIGLDPDSVGVWGFVANRGYGLMCKYTTSNYGRIFVDSSSPYPFVINMPSTDRLFVTDNSDNFIANFYGRSSGLSNLGGLDMFGPIRLLTTNTPPTGASEGMIFYHTDYDELWLYRASGWKALAFVP